MYLQAQPEQKSDLEKAALELARANAASEEAIERIYLFHDEKQQEIRLVEVDSSVGASETVQPWYFRANPDKGAPFAIAIALITPEEERERIQPPPGWNWNAAKVIWRRGEAHG